MRLARLLAVTPILAVGLAACGGDDGPTKDDFIAKGDAVCRDLRVQGDEIENAGTPESPEELKRYAEDIERFISGGLARFRAIELPKDSGDREGAQTYIDQLAKAGNSASRMKAEAAELTRAVADQDRAKVQTVGEELKRTAQRVQDESDRADALARDYGLRACAA